MKRILGQSAFWQVNKAIARHFKCNDTALLLSDLIDSESFYSDRNQLTDDGYFFKTSEKIETDVNISYRRQKKCIKNLKDEGFIDTKLAGIPAKLHFRVAQNKILHFVKTSVSKNAEQDTAIRQTNNNIDKEVKQRIDKEIDSDFENLWKTLGKHGNKQTALSRWNKLSKVDKVNALVGAERYANWLKEKGDFKTGFQKRTETYLNKDKKYWLDELPKIGKEVKNSNSPKGYTNFSKMQMPEWD